MMQKQKGFTLIEVMIVVSIVAILAAIAVPSYQSSVSKGRRTDAMAALQGLAQAMERHYMTTGAYTGAAFGGGNNGAPTIFSTKSPIDGSQTFYDLTIATAATTYTLTADPTNGQEGDGNITLTQTGARAWDRDNDGAYNATTENCWETSC